MHTQRKAGIHLFRVFFWSLLTLIITYGTLSLLLAFLLRGMQQVILQPTERGKKLARRWRALSFKLAKSRFFPLFGILKHVGRSSGRVYETPLGVHPLGDGFALPLAWGTNTDWCRNVMAAGTCTLIWKGREYALGHPEILPASGVRVAYPPGIVLLLGGIALFGGFRGREIKQYMWLHAA